MHLLFELPHNFKIISFSFCDLGIYVYFFNDLLFCLVRMLWVLLECCRLTLISYKLFVVQISHVPIRKLVAWRKWDREDSREGRQRQDKTTDNDNDSDSNSCWIKAISRLFLGFSNFFFLLFTLQLLILIKPIHHKWFTQIMWISDKILHLFCYVSMYLSNNNKYLRKHIFKHNKQMILLESWSLN